MQPGPVTAFAVGKVSPPEQQYPGYPVVAGVPVQQYPPGAYPQQYPPGAYPQQYPPGAYPQPMGVYPQPVYYSQSPPPGYFQRRQYENCCLAATFCFIEFLIFLPCLLLGG